LNSSGGNLKAGFLLFTFLFLFRSNTVAKVKLLDLDSYISFEKVGENFFIESSAAERHSSSPPREGFKPNSQY
jgi:hypothetical protein